MSVAAAWSALHPLAAADAATPIAQHFKVEPNRVAKLSVSAAGLWIDLTKQAWSQATVDALVSLAEAAEVEAARKRMYSGEIVNVSEGRAVLHTALRATDAENRTRAGAEIAEVVAAGRAQQQAFVEGVRSGAITGATGKRFTHILHLGIGGSDLGPRVVWDALRPAKPDIDIKFAANVDGSEIVLQLAQLDPETTLVIAVSKTFTTQETLANLDAAQAWLAGSLGADKAGQHIAAVSAAPAKAAAYGVAPDRVFGFWDWVGGRYSLWSGVSLSIAVAIGWDAFAAFLEGARQMDLHFESTPLANNAPVLLALAQVYNRVLLNKPWRASIPYAHRLRRFSAFLQQLEMESNGKHVGPDGVALTRPTCPVVFGDEGTNAQHAFFQLLHQSADAVPIEFIAVLKNPESPAGMHEKLLANVLAQSEAFMNGKTLAEAEAELRAEGKSDAEIALIAPQKVCPGNRPSSLIWLHDLSPGQVGALIALFEHKTFVEGLLFGVNSFDQWGVELGKALAKGILSELTGGPRQPRDPSSEAMIGYIVGQKG